MASQQQVIEEFLQCGRCKQVVKRADADGESREIRGLCVECAEIVTAQHIDCQPEPPLYKYAVGDVVMFEDDAFAHRGIGKVIAQWWDWEGFRDTDELGYAVQCPTGFPKPYQEDELKPVSAPEAAWAGAVAMTTGTPVIQPCEGRVYRVKVRTCERQFVKAKTGKQRLVHKASEWRTLYEKQTIKEALLEYKTLGITGASNLDLKIENQETGAWVSVSCFGTYGGEL